jgi:hypothetical protein
MKALVDLDIAPVLDHFFTPFPHRSIASALHHSMAL